MTLPAHLTVGVATDEDAASIAAVRLAAARDLTARYGSGTWSFSLGSTDAVIAELRSSTILVAREGGVLLGTLRLSTKNPWLGDIDFFTPSERPIYLTSMAVAPTYQRQGVGRRLLEAAKRVAIDDLRGEAIRLDSYDAPAGAGEFYAKSGFRLARRGSYHGTPLLWFEWFSGYTGSTTDGHG